MTTTDEYEAEAKRLLDLILKEIREQGAEPEDYRLLLMLLAKRARALQDR